MAVSTVVQFRPFALNVTFTDLLYALAALLWMFRLANGAQPLVEYVRRGKAHLFCALLFAFGASLSLMNARSPADALISMSQYGFVFAVLLPLFSMAFQNGESMRPLLISFALSGHIASGIAAADFIGLIHVPGASYGSGRYLSLLNNANAFALVAAMNIPVSLAFAAAPGKRVLRLYFAFGAALSAYGLALSASLGGFLGALVGLAAFACFSALSLSGRARRRLLFALGAVCVLAAAGAYYGFSSPGRLPVPTRFVERVVSLSSIQESDNYATRAELAAHAVKTLSKQPLVGLGQEQHRQYTPSGHSVHVNYLLVFVENGLFGIIGYIGILALLLWKALRLLRAAPLELRPLAAGLAASFLAFLSILCVHTNVHMRYAWAPALLIAAWSASATGAGSRSALPGASRSAPRASASAQSAQSRHSERATSAPPSYRS